MKVVNGVQVVSLEVNPTSWNAIQKGLALLPYGEVAGLLNDLAQQVVQQSQPPVGKPPAPIEPNDTLKVATPVA